MSRKQVLIKGTIILTLTGFATRFMGFFYRIFLSHTFGEEGVGIYQLIFPIYAMGFSLTSAGIVLRVSFFRFAQLHLRLLSRNEEDEDSIRLATDRADYTNWFRLALIYDQPHTGAPFWNRRRSLRADCR